MKKPLSRTASFVHVASLNGTGCSSWLGHSSWNTLSLTMVTGQPMSTSNSMALLSTVSVNNWGGGTSMAIARASCGSGWGAGTSGTASVKKNEYSLYTGSEK